MQEIADWLDKLGVGQYAQRLAEDDISFFILPDLTDQDLEKIGGTIELQLNFQLLEPIYLRDQPVRISSRRRFRARSSVIFC